jgi:hypothetical protein
VDKISDEETENIKKLRIKIRYIEDKIVLPACVSEQFEKITDNNEFELWHFVLKNNNIHKKYGIYINDGILSESCSESSFNK